ncbi:MAG: 4Fe-4S dicluster domain-containing protein [Candidatus Bathyarchaeia archaeon]
MILKPLYLAFIHIFKRTFTIKSPFVMLKPTPRTTGRLQLDLQRCISCGLCAKVCPTEAITMVDYKGVSRPQIDYGRCIVSCEICQYLCPSEAYITIGDYEISSYTRGGLVYSPRRLSRPTDIIRGRKTLLAKVYKKRGVGHVPVTP